MITEEVPTEFTENISDEQRGILQTLLDRVEKRGDLPIFNASLSKVRKVSSDPDSHAIELAQIIMKDSNLTTKLLRVANSPFYNRGVGKIVSVSRAVVLLGFDTIKNLCLTLKLIESFQEEHPSIGMHEMLSRAYLTAGFARDLAMKSGIKEVEETYLCGLFHGLGEIAVAFFMPQTFNEIYDLHRSKGLTWPEAQQRVLGMPFSAIGQRIASQWNFSNKITSTMREYRPELEGPVKKQEQLRHALVGLGSQAVGILFVPQRETKKSLHELLGDLADATGLRLENVENSLTHSFEQSCELAKEYGLNNRVLQPQLAESGDPMRDRIARQMAYFASNRIDGRGVAPTLGTAKEPAGFPKTTPPPSQSSGSVPSALQPPQAVGLTAPDTTPSAKPSAQTGEVAETSRGDPHLQLAIIQEITTMVAEGATLNKLFVKILEGLQRGVGFDRAALVLANPDRTSYTGRIALGSKSDVLKQALSGQIDIQSDVISRVLLEGADLIVDNVDEASWKGLISPSLRKLEGAKSFLLAGVRGSGKPLGVFYADNGLSLAPVTTEQKRGFRQFVAQARLAVKIRG